MSKLVSMELELGEKKDWRKMRSTVAEKHYCGVCKSDAAYETKHDVIFDLPYDDDISDDGVDVLCARCYRIHVLKKVSALRNNTPSRVVIHMKNVDQGNALMKALKKWVERCGMGGDSSIGWHDGDDEDNYHDCGNIGHDVSIKAECVTHEIDAEAVNAQLEVEIARLHKELEDAGKWKKIGKGIVDSVQQLEEAFKEDGENNE